MSVSLKLGLVGWMYRVAALWWSSQCVSHATYANVMLSHTKLLGLHQELEGDSCAKWRFSWYP